MKTVFFTGAGISAESGIQTYRGTGGVYTTDRIDEWLTGETYRDNPDKINGYLDAVLTAVKNAHPNAAHKAIAEYARKYPETIVFTQNVDTLFEQAGCFPVHVHGVIDQFACWKCHMIMHGYETRPKKCWCGADTRYNVVLFEEDAPEYVTLNAVIKTMKRGDNFVVVGTSGVVLPVNRIVRKLGFKGVNTYLNNLEHSHDVADALFTRSLRGNATEKVPQIIKLIDK